MLRKFKGISPDVDPKAHVFESADVIGMKSAVIPTSRITAASMWQTAMPASSGIM